MELRREVLGEKHPASLQALGTEVKAFLNVIEIYPGIVIVQTDKVDGVIDDHTITSEPFPRQVILSSITARHYTNGNLSVYLYFVST